MVWCITQNCLARSLELSFILYCHLSNVLISAQKTVLFVFNRVIRAGLHQLIISQLKFYLFNYTDFSQHNKYINNNYIYSLQLHVSTHMSHLQARTIFVCKATGFVLGSQDEPGDFANKYSSSLEMTHESKHVAVNYKCNCC